MTWEDFLRTKPCLKCGSWPVELAHIHGLVSPKTDQVMPRRKGLARFAAIPLCPGCHRTGKDSIHRLGEDEFFRQLGRHQCYVFQKLVGYLAEYKGWAT